MDTEKAQKINETLEEFNVRLKMLIDEYLVEKTVPPIHLARVVSGHQIHLQDLQTQYGLEAAIESLTTHFWPLFEALGKANANAEPSP